MSQLGADQGMCANVTITVISRLSLPLHVMVMSYSLDTRDSPYSHVASKSVDMLRQDPGL